MITLAITLERVRGPCAPSRPLLTPREVQVPERIASGRSNKEIAHELGLSEQTIKNHLSIIFQKLAANDRAHAVTLARRYGWIVPPTP